MDSNKIFEVIEQIAATSSKNEKQKLVSVWCVHQEFQRVLKYAYDPFKTYGIRQIPTKRVSGGRAFEDVTWEVLDDLIARRLTGNAARDAVQAEIDMLSESSAELFIRIIRKDLRAGFSESTCNKAVKGLIPDFPYMRCSLPKDADLTKWPWEDGAISQEKADGMFANVDHEEGGLVSIRSRQGSEFPIEKFADLAAEVRSRLTPGHQQHGEIVVMRGSEVLERQIGNGMLNSVLNGGDFESGCRPVFLVWDQIPLSAVVTKGKYEVAYRERLKTVIQQLKSTPGSSINMIPTKVVRSLREAYTHAVELMKLGKEGTIIKHPKAIWKDGTSKEQIKIKLEFEVDLQIVGIVPGREGTKNEGRAGSFACRSSCGALLVDVTVKNEALRDRVDKYPEEFIGKIVAVIANDILEPSESNSYHSLFLPRMAEADYRRDKTEADGLLRIYAQKEAAIFGEALMKEAA